MSRSCMSKACCQWPHDRYPSLACQGRVVHGCMLVPSRGGCHDHACPKHVTYGRMTDVLVLLVRVGRQGRQPIEWGRMSRSCMSKACCQWPHDRYPNLACPGCVVHGCTPFQAPFTCFHVFTILYWVSMRVYDHSQK